MFLTNTIKTIPLLLYVRLHRYTYGFVLLIYFKIAFIFLFDGLRDINLWDNNKIAMINTDFLLARDK